MVLFRCYVSNPGQLFERESGAALTAALELRSTPNAEERRTHTVSKFVRQSHSKGVSNARARTGSGLAGRAVEEVRIPKTAEVIAGKIRNQIIRGELALGEFLPSEADLMARFSTSRPTLREAFRILESEHFLTTKRGPRGGAVAQVPDSDLVAKFAGYVLQSQGADLSDLYMGRMAIEPVVVKLLAAEGNKQVVARLRDQVAEIRMNVEAGEAGNILSAGLKFHELLVDLAESNTFSLLFNMVERVYEQHQKGIETPPSIARMSESRQARIVERFLSSFSRLVDLIEIQDVDGAVEHWIDHINLINKVWLTDFKSTALVEVLE